MRCVFARMLFIKITSCTVKAAVSSSESSCQIVPVGGRCAAVKLDLAQCLFAHYSIMTMVAPDCCHSCCLVDANAG